MRTKDEVLGKFYELRKKLLSKRKEERLSRCPRNCAFNRAVRVKGKGEVRLCGNSEVLAQGSKPLFVCSEDETARACKQFQTKMTEGEIEEEFDEILESPARCGHEYPKLAILIWFLQDFGGNIEGEGNRWSRVCRLTSDLLLFRWW